MVGTIQEQPLEPGEGTAIAVDDQDSVHNARREAVVTPCAGSGEPSAPTLPIPERKP